MTISRTNQKELGKEFEGSRWERKEGNIGMWKQVTEWIGIEGIERYKEDCIRIIRKSWSLREKKEDIIAEI